MKINQLLLAGLICGAPLLASAQINVGIGDKDFVQPPMPPNSDVVEGPYTR